MSSDNRIARDALLVGLGNVGSRVLGLVREQVIAGLFGASTATDAFRVAFRVPLTLYDLLVGGMISAALVPVFSGYLARGQHRELAVLVNTLGALLFAGLVMVAVLLSALAAPLMDAIAAGYEPPVRATSADLLRLLLPALLFMGLSALMTAVLYAQRRFRPPSLALMAFNLGIILLGLLFNRVLGVLSLAVGTLAGAAGQLSLLFWAARRLSFRGGLSLTHPGLAEVGRLYLPVALGLLVSTAGVLIDTNLASTTGEGGLAAMGFATALVQFPLGLVASGVSSAVLPVLSQHAASTADLPAARPSPLAPRKPPEVSGSGASPADTFRGALGLGLRMVLLAILPATVGLVLLRRPLIRTLFQRGAFDALATERTASALLAYSPGLPAAALDQVLIQGYYARRKTLTPVLVGVVSVGVYLVTAFALLGPMGMPGLALANSAQWTAHLVVMAILTQRATGGMRGFGLGGTALRAAAASAVVAALLASAMALTPPEGLHGAALALYLAVLVVLAAGVYAALLARTGPADFRLLVGLLRRPRAG